MMLPSFVKTVAGNTCVVFVLTFEFDENKTIGVWHITRTYTSQTLQNHLFVDVPCSSHRTVVLRTVATAVPTSPCVIGASVWPRRAIVACQPCVRVGPVRVPLLP